MSNFLNRHLPFGRRSHRSGTLIATGAILSLELNDDCLVAVEATVAAGRIQILRMLRAAWPEHLESRDDTQATAQWIRQQLNDAGVSATRAVVTVPRKVIALKKLRVATAPENELPQLVRLQAGRRSPLPPEQLVVDFVPLGTQTPDDGQDILAASVPESAVAVYRDILISSGLKLVALVASPQAVTQLISEDTVHETGTASLLICPSDRRVEISVLAAGELTFSYATSVEARTSEQWASAIHQAVSRVLMLEDAGLSGQLPNDIFMIGGDAEAGPLLKGLEQVLSVDITVCHPLHPFSIDSAVSIPENVSAFASPLGSLLLATSGTVERINLLSPRKATTQVNRPMLHSALGLVLLVFVCATLWMLRNRQLDELTRQIDDLSTVQQQLQAAVSEGEAELLAVQTVEKWNSRQLDWMDELLALTNVLPETEQAYITELRCAIDTGEAIGSLKATGYASSRDEVMSLTRRLLNDRERLELIPHSISESDRDEEYPSRFEVEYKLFEPLDAAEQGHADGAAEVADNE